MTKLRRLVTLAVSGTLILALLASQAAGAQTSALVIAKQGTFTVGGIVTSTKGTYDPTKPFDPSGQTTHDGHASVFYEIPENAKRYPIVFLHGYGQSRVCWQTTADGRPGFDTIFMRKGYGVYLVDQPGRGEAAQTANPTPIAKLTQDQNWFTQFRIGLWPSFYKGVQFPKDSESLNQFFRQMTPDTGSYTPAQIFDAMVGVFKKSGPAILMTHSAGGGSGWDTAMKTSNVKGVIAIEPGNFPFPKNEMPNTIDNKYMPLNGDPVSDADFQKLTKIPIVIYYGDNIPTQPSKIPAEDFWRAELQMAHIWAGVINAHGGDVTIVHLPDVGIKGNTHFMFSDLNNQQVADNMAAWLIKKGLK